MPLDQPALHEPPLPEPPERAPVPDSTIRMDAARPSDRPPATGPAPTAPPAPPSGEPDDTRPVPRDWMRGAEEAPAAPSTTAHPPAARPPAADPPATASVADPATRTVLTEAGPGTRDWADDPSSWEDETTTWAADETAWEGELAEDTAAPTTAIGFENDGGANEGFENDGGTDDDTAAFAGLRDEDGPDGPGTGGAGRHGPRRPWWHRRAVLIPAAAVAVLGGAYGVDLLVERGEVPRHTVVGGVDIGGLEPSAASRALQTSLAPRIAADRKVQAADVTATFSPKSSGLGLDVTSTVAAAERPPLNPWTRLTSLFHDRAVTPVLATRRTDLDGALQALATQVDRAPVEASISIQGTTPSLVQPADGRRLDRAGASAAITAALVGGSGGTIRLPVTVTHPHVTTATAQKVLDGTVTPGLAGPVTVVSQTGSTKADVPPGAIAAALTFTPKADGTLAVGIDPAKLQAALGTGFARFGTPAKDATFKVSGDTISVVPSVDGSGVDPAKLAAQLLTVLDKPAPRQVTAELGPVPAGFTTEQANALGIKEKVSSFTTRFSMSPSATNIRVVAEKVNGALVKPGDTFSLNTFTGTRGTAQGYVPAVVIEGGRFTMAVGGGISQFATTMYNAAFFAGVQDVHHQPHSYYISRYPAGREATVFDGLIDLVWKNDSNTGIYVQTAWDQGSITVTFWGTRHYTIESVSSDRSNVVDPPVQDAVDDGKCIAQAGMQGFDITVTRVFKDPGSGAVLRKESFRTHYQVEPILHCVPPPPAAPPAPGSTGGARAPSATLGGAGRKRPVRPRR